MSNAAPQPENLSVSLDDGLWIVEDRASRRWWTVSSTGEDAVITSSAGRVVKSTAQLGTLIRAAVFAADQQGGAQ